MMTLSAVSATWPAHDDDIETIRIPVFSAPCLKKRRSLILVNHHESYLAVKGLKVAMWNTEARSVTDEKLSGLQFSHLTLSVQQQQ